MPATLPPARRPQSTPLEPAPERRRGLAALLRLLLLAPWILAAGHQPARAQYLVIDGEGRIRGERPVPQAEPSGALTALSPSPVCGLFATAWHGQPVPGGGWLSPAARGAPISVNSAGQAAFFARIDGSLRNQGVFVKDGSGLHPIVIGCGSYLGSGDPGTACGDPSPIGGTFTGFYPGSGLPPSINDAGDVLFLADVVGGSARRGLFLYRKSSGAIEKVAALGDPSPVGPLTGLGDGALNNDGTVAFLGGPGPSNEGMSILEWREGTMRIVARPGTQLPGGRVISLVWFGWNAPDGTYVPLGEIPDINNVGQVAFHAILDSGAGLYVWRDGTLEPYVLTGQSSPAGGVFFSLYAPILNDAGQIAFQGEYEIDPWIVGWFVGRPGQWREVISFFDPILGGEVYGMAVSHNPEQPIDEDGNLIVWSDIRFGDGSWRQAVHIGYADGTLETIAAAGDPSPLGGTLGELSPFPSLEGRRCGLGASLSGVPGVYSTHLELLKRPLQTTGLLLGAPDPSSGAALVTWDSQAAPSDGSRAHDLLRGSLSGFAKPAQCAAADLPGTAWMEAAAGCPASPGEGCWYLVRAEDTCGRGPYGEPGTVCADPCDAVPVPGCPVCGNGVIEGAEECDGADLAGETCASLGYDVGTLGCSAQCTLDLSGCATICGNGIVSGNEECDGANLRTRRCGYFGYDRGILACTQSCTFDFTGCCCTDGTPGCAVCPVCGNGVREPPYELCDGFDTGGETCWSLGHPPGTLGCNYQCDQYDISGCVGW